MRRSRFWLGIAVLGLLIQACSEHPAQKVAQEACEALKVGNSQKLQALSVIHMAGKLDSDYLLMGAFMDHNQSTKSTLLKSMQCQVIRVKEGKEGTKIVYIRKMQPLYLKEVEGEWKIIQ